MYALYLTQNVIAINLNDILKIVSGQEKTPETRSFWGPSGEAQTGFEPVDTGVEELSRYGSLDSTRKSFAI